jgi:hypothetical protein
MHKASFLKKNRPSLNPNVGVISFFHCKRFRYRFLRMFLLDLISIDSIVPWYHPSILSFLILSRRKDPIHTALFFTPWIDATRPPHRTALQWQYPRFDFIVGRTIVHSHHAY